MKQSRYELAWFLIILFGLPSAIVVFGIARFSAFLIHYTVVFAVIYTVALEAGLFLLFSKPKIKPDRVYKVVVKLPDMEVKRKEPDEGGEEYGRRI